MRWACALVALILLAVPAAAQYGPSMTSFAVEQDTAPAAPFQGKTWIRTTDYKRFVYVSDTSEYLGPGEEVCFCHTAAGKIGFFRYFNADTDSTTATRRGWLSGGRYRLVSARGTNSSSLVDCTVNLYSQATAWKTFTWNGQAEDADWTAAAGDTLESGDILSMETTGTTGPSDGCVCLVFKERVAAP